jgi:hypothetical protein
MTKSIATSLQVVRHFAYAFLVMTVHMPPAGDRFRANALPPQLATRVP